MELVIGAAVLYFLVSAALPLAPVLRARFVKTTHHHERELLIFRDNLPPGKFMASVWAYGHWCIIIDTDRGLSCDDAMLQRGLRHELGHLVMGHARKNTLLCACGLWFLTPFFRARQEYEADMFSIAVKVAEIKDIFWR